jgi:hypothetical protein
LNLKEKERLSDKPGVLVIYTETMSIQRKGGIEKNMGRKRFGYKRSMPVWNPS